MALTHFQGFLAMLTDSEYSWPFYLAAVYQLIVLGFGCSQRVRVTRWYALAAGISHILLTLFLAAGFYYATRPVA